MDGCLLKDEFMARVVSIRQWQLFQFILWDSKLLQLVCVNGSGSSIIARLEEGRVLCFGLVNELAAGGNWMVLW